MTTFRYIGLPVLLGRAKAAALAGVTASADELADRIRDEVPRGATDALHGSVRVDGIETTVDSVTATVAAGGGEAWYAIIVHEGAVAHEIRPVEGALQIGGEFAGRVHHPGLTGTKFVEGPLLSHRVRHVALLAAAARKAF